MRKRKYFVSLFILACGCGFGCGLGPDPSFASAELLDVHLEFSQLELNLSATTPAPVDGVYPIRSSASQSTVLVKQGSIVSGLIREDSQPNWKLAWQQQLLGAVNTVDLFGTGARDVLIVRAPRGLQFYRIQNADPGGLTFLGQDGRFDSVYGWNEETAVVVLTWDYIFPAPSYLGFVTRDLRGDVNFYALNPEHLYPNNSYPLLNFDGNVNVPAWWKEPSTSLFTVQLSNTHPQAWVQAWIGSWSVTSGLCLHYFDKDYNLRTCGVALPNLLRHKTSRIFWAAAVTNNGLWKDLVVWSENSGLTMYKYDQASGRSGTTGSATTTGTFVLHSQFKAFSVHFGWTTEHVSSMLFGDVGGATQLVALGPNYLDMYAINNGSIHSVLRRELLPASLEYAKPVGVVFRQLFVQDQAGRVYFSKGAGAKLAAPAAPKKHEPAASTLTQPTSTSTPPPPPRESLPVVVVAEEKQRWRQGSKLDVHWMDKWGNTLTNPVDDWGNVNFMIPLFDQSSESGLAGMSLALTYSSSVAAAAGQRHEEEAAAWIGSGGSGWQMALIGQFIVADVADVLMISYSWHSSSSSNTNTEQLQLSPTAPTGGSSNTNVYEAKLSNLTFRYDAGTQTWTSESDTEATIYGAAMQWSLTGKTWGGPFLAANDDGLPITTTGTDLVRIPIRWFVRERRSKVTGTTCRYEYEHEEHDTAGYTTGVRLSGIQCESLGFSVKFGYEKKQGSEYRAQSPWNLAGKNLAAFPVPLTQDKYLSRVEIRHVTYQQIYAFKYVVTGVVGERRRRLSAIEQVYDCDMTMAPVPVMTFEYDHHHHQHSNSTSWQPRLLTGVQLTDQVKYTFTYDGAYQPPPPPPLQDPTSAFNINEGGTLVSGPGYLLHSYVVRLTPDYVVLQFLSQDGYKGTALGRLTTEGVGLRSASVATDRIISQKVRTNANSVFLLVRKEASLHVYVIEGGGGDETTGTKSWTMTTSLYTQFSNDSVAKAEICILIVQDPRRAGELTIFQETGARVTKSVLALHAEPGAFAVDNGLIVAYDDHSLVAVRRLHPRAAGGNWTRFTLRDPVLHGVISKSKEAIAKFEISSTLEKNLHQAFVQDGGAGGCVMMARNLVVLRGIELDNDSGRLYTRLVLVVLTPNGSGDHDTVTIARTQVLRVAKESVPAIREALTDNSGNQYHVQYFFNWHIGKFVITISWISGPIMDEINKIRDSKKRSDELKHTLDAMNKGEEWVKKRKELSLVNWGSYGVQVLPNGLVLVGNDTLFAPSAVGGQWTQVPIDEMGVVTNLGTRFLLEHNPFDGGRRYDVLDSEKQRRLLRSIHVDPPHFFVNGYPFFIAYQATLSRVHVLTFKDGGRSFASTHTHVFENETLHFATGLTHLVTVRGWQFVLRAVSTLLEDHHQRPPVLLSQTTLQATGACPQLTAYEHKLVNDRTNQTSIKSILVIPAGARGVSGWTQDTWTIRQGQNGSNTLTRTTSVYSSDGTMVQEERKQVDLDQATVKSDIDAHAHAHAPDWKYKLMDITSRWTILDRYPHLASDNMVDYFGFESYEAADRASEWGVDETHVVGGGWAYTGSRYLHAQGLGVGIGAGTGQQSPHRYLTRTLVPRDQTETYVVGAWLSGAGPVNTSLDYFKAVFKAASTGSQAAKLYGVLGQVKAVDGDWSYVEIVLDFSLAQDVYNEYYYYTHTDTPNATSTTMSTSTPTVQPSSGSDIVPPLLYYPRARPRMTTTLSVTIQLESPSNSTATPFVDVDHVAFYPIGLNFMAKVYKPAEQGLGQVQGLPSAVIKAGGQVARTHYNHLGIQVASWTTSPPSFEQFVSHSSWVAAHATHGAVGTLTLTPEAGLKETFDSYSMRHRWSTPNPGVNGWRRAPGQLIHVGRSWSKMSLRPDSGVLGGGSMDSLAIRLRYSFDNNSAPATATLKFEFCASFTVKFDHYANGTTLLKAGAQGGSLEVAVAGATTASTGELIVLIEGPRYIVFVNGVILFDKEVARAPAPNSKKAASADIDFDILASGDIMIDGVFFLSGLRLEMQYFNAFGAPTQHLQLENSSTVIVRETSYDALGWPTIITKATRVNRAGNEALLKHYDTFMTNGPRQSQSQHECVMPPAPDKKLTGLVNDLNPDDGGYPFTGTLYEKSPLRKAKARVVSHPGNSVNDTYTQRFSSSVPLSMGTLAWVHNVFPTWQGYRHEAKLYPNGKQRVTILDSLKQTVGVFVHGLEYEHTLTTYEYNDRKQLTRIVPPTFHEHVGTLSRRAPYNVQHGQTLSEGDATLALKDAMSTTYTYDEVGRLTRKSTTDAAPTEFMYSPDGHIRFALSFNRSHPSNMTGPPIKIKYFYRDEIGQLLRTGHLTKMLTRAELEQYLPWGHDLPEAMAVDYQTIYHNDDGKKRIITKGSDSSSSSQSSPVLDELQFNPAGQLFMRRTVCSTHAHVMRKEYNVRGQLTTLAYPEGLLLLHHTYNKLGQLVALGTPTDTKRFASFTYNADGQLATEHHKGHSESRATKTNFVRRFNYNSPGWLEEIHDPFMVQSLSYTAGGYGQGGYDEGIVMSMTFNSKWAGAGLGDFLRESRINAVDDKMLSVLNNTEVWTTCLKALKRTGHLSAEGRPLKLYRVIAEQLPMPTQCGGRISDFLSKLIQHKLWASFSGYSYAYGNQGELTKAKHFTVPGETPTPFGPASFAKQVANGVNESESMRIWNGLKTQGYIHVDMDGAGGGGERLRSLAKSLVREDDLQHELANISATYGVYTRKIQELIQWDVLASHESITLAKFEALLLQWSGFVDGPAPQLLIKQRRAAAALIFETLQGKGWFSTGGRRALDPGFLRIVHPHDGHADGHALSNIVRALLVANAGNVGQDPFDYESFRIDNNGNSRLTYSGSKRYNISFEPHTNKVSHVHVLSPSAPESVTYAMKHDAFGNVVQAEHKGIRQVTYDPVSNRPTVIDMDDGRQLRFTYDGQGERLLKEVYDGAGSLRRQVKYFRDELGRVLHEQEATFADTGERTEVIDTMTTSFIYGPRGSEGYPHLLGFVRNGIYYNVLTDHGGSIRLIVQDGKVVTAYDYAPYGELRRCFGCGDHQRRSQVSYKFTGQEYDEETGLYNFHARLYDPELGRFYIVDPRSQYLSPYTYAGNSPLSHMDPDGEFVFLLTAAIFGGLLGTYLGGAAANNRWNPADWDFRHSSTYLGMVGGGIAGALLPVGFGASVSALGGGTAAIASTTTLGVSGAYLLGAQTNHNWNPAKWAWDRPHTYSALFQGFAAGSSLPAGIKSVHHYAGEKLGRVGSKVFIGSSYGVGGGVAYAGGVLGNGGRPDFWNWDWTSPSTWNGIVNGFNSGFGWTQGFTSVGRGIGKAVGKAAKGVAANKGRLLASMGRTLKSSLSNPTSPLYKVVAANLMTYLNGAMANDDFDVTNWNFASFTTYEGLLNGAFLGKDVSNMLRQLQPLHRKPAVPAAGPKAPPLDGNPRMGAVRRWVRGLSDFAKDVRKYNLKMASRRLLTNMLSKNDASWLLSMLNARARASGRQRSNSDAEIIAFHHNARAPQRGRTAEPGGMDAIPTDVAMLLADQVTASTSSKFSDPVRTGLRQLMQADASDLVHSGSGRGLLLDPRDGLYLRIFGADHTESNLNHLRQQGGYGNPFEMDSLRRALDDIENPEVIQDWELAHLSNVGPDVVEWNDLAEMLDVHNCGYCTVAGLTRTTVRQILDGLHMMDLDFAGPTGSGSRLTWERLLELFHDVGFKNVYYYLGHIESPHPFIASDHHPLWYELQRQVLSGQVPEFGLAYRGHVVVLKAWWDSKRGVRTRIIDFQQPPYLRDQSGQLQVNPGRFRSDMLPTGKVYLIHTGPARGRIPVLEDVGQRTGGRSSAAGVSNMGTDRQYGSVSGGAASRRGSETSVDLTGWVQLKTGVTVGGFLASGARRTGTGQRNRTLSEE